MKVLSVLLCVVGITLASADPQPPAAAAAAAAPSVLARRLRGGTADGANEMTTDGKDTPTHLHACTFALRPAILLLCVYYLITGVVPETAVTAVETTEDKTEQSTAEAPGTCAAFSCLTHAQHVSGCPYVLLCVD